MSYLVLTVEPHGNGNRFCLGMDQYSFETIIPLLIGQQISLAFNEEEIPVEGLAFFNYGRLTEPRINQWIQENHYHEYPERSPTKLVFKFVGTNFIYYPYQAYWPLHI